VAFDEEALGVAMPVEGRQVAMSSAGARLQATGRGAEQSRRQALVSGKTCGSGAHSPVSREADWEAIASGREAVVVGNSRASSDERRVD
jgi:hypothetical protein